MEIFSVKIDDVSESKKLMRIYFYVPRFLSLSFVVNSLILIALVSFPVNGFC